MNNNDEFKCDKAYQEKLMKKFKSGPEWTRLQLMMIICLAVTGWIVAILIAILR